LRTLETDQLSRLYRMHAGAILARLIRHCGGDFARAEAGLHEAFRAASSQWSEHGTPAKPRVWLGQRAAQHVDAQAGLAADSGSAALDSTPPDDYLRLLFLCCHPLLGLEEQAALTLSLVCGLTRQEIAHAFLLEEAALTQCVARAQDKLRRARVPYEVPAADELDERLDAVLALVYFVYSEGYAATGSEALLCGEALRLGRLVVGLLPQHGEPWALLALLLLHESRSPARRSAHGELVLLADQDRSLWDQGLIAEGLGCLDRALGLGSFGAYALQAAIAQLHARARTVEETDWQEIARLYQRLLSRSDHAVSAALRLVRLEPERRYLARPLSESAH
jgi:RNA polymerase sigma-70 factor, ECF subfamily